MRLVLDTSVLIAALRSPSGASAVLVEQILDKRVTLLLSLALALEYRDVAVRPQQLAHFSLSLQQVQRLLKELEDLSESIETSSKRRPLSIDPHDDLVLELAIDGRADTIVTNNPPSAPRGQAVWH